MGLRSKSLLAISLVLGCGPSGPAMSTAPPVQHDTSLAPGDIFSVRVYGESGLSNKYQIAENGTIDFPLIGQTRVAGKEPPEVARLIEKRLKKGGYLRNPQVSIFLEERTSKNISIIGAVNSPGQYPIRPGMTMVQAISQAGGFKPIASQNHTIVTRRIDGEIKRFEVPAGDMVEGAAEDFPLQAGDIIYVPERLF